MDSAIDASWFLRRSKEQNQEMVDGWVKRGWATRPSDRQPDSSVIVKVDPSSVRSLIPAGKGQQHKWTWHEGRDRLECEKCGLAREHWINGRETPCA